jgi:site-specific DNA-methyltransferase (adenine-specific)
VGQKIAVPITLRIITYQTQLNTFHFRQREPTFNSIYDNGIYKYPLCHGKQRFDHPTQKATRINKFS